MNKVTLGLVLLVALLGFLLLTTNKDNAMQNAMPKSLKIPAVAGDAQVSTIKVSASESRKYEANEFVTVAMLELRGRDKELLFKQLETRRQSIFEQMNKLDIQNSDIEQNSVDMRKEWSYDKGTRSLTGYVVSQSFAIRCSSRSVAAVGKKAMSKAESYAESVGGKVGRVISVNENGGNDGVAFGRTVLAAAKFNDYSEEALLSSIADSVSLSASVHLVVELLQ